MHTIVYILGSMLLLGMRHGIDHDHIAAITDLTALQRAPGRAMRLGLIYAAGHAIVLFGLGAGAVLIGVQFPESWEWMREKVVGVTLIALGLSVVGGMIAHYRNHHDGQVHIPSRAGIVLAIVRRLRNWFRRVYGLAPIAQTKRAGETPAFVTGIIHGLGAETPSQLLLLVVAAGMGSAAGLLCVGSFVTGLFITNTIMCAVMVGLYRKQETRRKITLVLSGASAVYSVVVGIVYLV